VVGVNCRVHLIPFMSSCTELSSAAYLNLSSITRSNIEAGLQPFLLWKISNIYILLLLHYIFLMCFKLIKNYFMSLTCLKDYELITKKIKNYIFYVLDFCYSFQVFYQVGVLKWKFMFHQNLNYTYQVF
jgi:hypothetical protein